MKQKVFFKTFGCRTNMFDSQVMMSRLKDFDITLQEEDADIVVVNSCTVTNGADSNVRTYINHMRNLNKEIYLTGCGAHTKGESLFEQEKVFGVFGQSEKERINSLLNEKKRFYELGDLDFIDKNIVEEFAGKSRAFIKIQEGCNFRCSYCIIPFVRGDARSMEEEQILEQIRVLAANGFGEFVLSGTNVGSYGHRQGRSIAGLMKRISLIRGVRRIRIGSLEPIQVTGEFMEILDEPWLEKHLHIALQHTSDDMLRVMNRRNRYASDLKLFESLAEKGFALGTDFIVGHPGETESIWNESAENLNRLPLTHIHPFTYSKRDGTPSAVMKPEINGLVSKARMKTIVDIVENNNLMFRRGSKVALEVLVENKKNGLYYGLDQFFNKVVVKSPDDLVGNWIVLEDYKARKDHNYAELQV